MKVSSEIAESLYLALLRCRKFDEKIVELYPQKEMRCPTHLSIGQEAIAAGVCVALRKEDIIFSTHRSHSPAVAKSGELKSLMAELYGKVTGCSKGKGGSMHFVDKEAGLFGCSAIVGGTIPLAVGTALAAKMQGIDRVSVAFFGDGAMEQGTFHESMNFASLHKLPVLFVCENNGLATCTPLRLRQPYEELYQRAEGYRMPGVRVDGTKILEVYHASREAVARARRGEGPTLIEGTCYRWKEHCGPNFDYHLGYRTKEELEEWMKKCPVKQFEELLSKEGILDQTRMHLLQAKVQTEIEEAVKFAKASPFPNADEIFSDI